MRKSLLNAFFACGLVALLFTSAGCGSTKITPGGPREFAPQTGSMIGRRLPASAVQATESAPSPSSKSKAQKAKKETKRERASDDYMTRGGFR